MQIGSEKRRLRLCILRMHVLCCMLYVYVFVHAYMLLCAFVHKKKRQLTSTYKLHIYILIHPQTEFETKKS